MTNGEETPNVAYEAKHVRIARLRDVLSRLCEVLSNERYGVWLTSPIQAFENQCPLDLVLSGKYEILADYIEDMLAGTPS